MDTGNSKSDIRPRMQLPADLMEQGPAHSITVPNFLLLEDASLQLLIIEKNIPVPVLGTYLIESSVAEPEHCS